MSPSDAHLADRQERQSVMAPVAVAVAVAVTVPDHDRCSPQCAPSVVRKPKYPLSPVKADRVLQRLLQQDQTSQIIPDLP